MKRLQLFLLILPALLGCAREIEENQINGIPYFSIQVQDESSVPLTELDEMSAQYTLQMGADGYSATANATNHVSRALRFHITTNLRWKIVPTDEENVPDWIHPFPESGEKDGIFFFKTDRNVDPENARESYFNILVDKGSGIYEPLEGILQVKQDKSPLFLEMNAAKFSVAATGQTIRLRVKANVDWNYSLAPSDEFATENLDWIVDETEHAPQQQNDTIVLAVAANEKGMRGAVLNVNYTLDGVEKTDVVAITQYPEAEVSLEGFPVKWLVRVDGNTFMDTFASNGTGATVSGGGMITFNNDSGKALDASGNCMFDVSDKSPRVTGVWPGDYCQFVASSPVSAGTIVKLAFATRSSAAGQKYWRLEYRDGEQWKIAGKSYTDPSVNGPDGAPVVYTHAMNEDGSTNVLVETAVTYENATDQVEFRFICAANWRANGAAPPSKPGTATWRLSVDTADANDAYQPCISIIAAGGEPPVQANMSLSHEYLYFDSNPKEAKSFKVTSDQDFNVKSEQSWIKVMTSQMSSGENVAVEIECERNTGAKSREGKVIVIAGITRQEIAVIQGAAGASGTGGEVDLDPFVSVTTGSNVALKYKKGSTQIKVMSNMTLTHEISDSWLSLSVASTETMSTVTTTTYNVTYGMNPSAESERTASIRFYNGSRDAVVTFTQERNISNETIYFEDDFSWLAPFVEAYKAQVPDEADKLDPVGSNISTHSQPNIWSKFSDTVGAEFTKRGYVDLNPGAKTLYVQDCYLKLGKGHNQTGITLPALEFEGTAPVDVVISFDWCAHMSNAGNIDAVPLVVALEGPGLCDDTDAAVSNEFKTTQAKGNLAWQSASLVLKGVTKDTRISIKPNYDTFTQDGNHRWHIDNILIIKNK